MLYFFAATVNSPMLCGCLSVLALKELTWTVCLHLTNFGFVPPRSDPFSAAALLSRFEADASFARGERVDVLEEEILAGALTLVL
jgi:hypothetical protein